jgi:hypothetical protein
MTAGPPAPKFGDQAIPPTFAVAALRRHHPRLPGMPLNGPTTREVIQPP